MFNKYRKWSCVVILPFLTACATPNLTPWAEATASLNAAVAVEQEMTITRMTEAQARIAAWNSQSERVGKIKTFVKSYQANAKQIETVLDLVVDYSNTLTELAAAGESGEKAATDVMDSLKKGTDLLNLAIPGGGVAADVASRAFTAVAAAYTRIEAQKTLAVVMKAAEEGNPNPSVIVLNGKEINVAASTPGFVPVLAEQLIKQFQAGPPSGAQRLIVAGFRGLEDGLDLDIAGLNRVAFYQGMNITPKKIGNVEATRLDHYFADLNNRLGRQNPTNGICWNQPEGEEDPDCINGEAAQSLDSIMALIIATEQNSKEFTKRRAVNARFQRQRDAAADSIVKAVKLWRDEHKRIADEIERCGGWNAITETACGNLTFSNLQAAVEKLKIIVSIGDK